MNSIDVSHKFYENSYKKTGINSQRKYPNEEICRFIGRNFSHLSDNQKENIKILETGCGSGANLWMIAREGFDTYGIDFSAEAINLAQKTLENFNVKAHLFMQDMCDLEFSDDFFDVIVDVFSSNCLTYEMGLKYLKSVKRKLKKNGVFFSYFPSKTSDAFLLPGDSNFIDSSTLDCISRLNSPFTGQEYPFRFLHPKEYEQILISFGFSIQYSEVLTKSYNNQTEKFSWCVIEAHSKNTL